MIKNYALMIVCISTLSSCVLFPGGMRSLTADEANMQMSEPIPVYSGVDLVGFDISFKNTHIISQCIMPVIGGRLFFWTSGEKRDFVQAEIAVDLDNIDPSDFPATFFVSVQKILPGETFAQNVPFDQNRYAEALAANPEMEDFGIEIVSVVYSCEDIPDSTGQILWSNNPEKQPPASYRGTIAIYSTTPFRLEQ